MKFFMAFMLVCSSIFGQVITLHGYIPPGIDRHSIETHYRSIEQKLDTAEGTGNYGPVHIIFYRKSEQRMHGIRLPEWGGGGAVGMDTIVIPVDAVGAFHGNNMQKIILHELVHIAITRRYGNVRVPRWFHEGVAMTLSGEFSLDEQVTLARAIITRTTIPLDSIEYVNRFPRWKAELAYSQCHAVLSYLIGTYGIDLIPELLLAARTTRYFERACVEVFGMTIKEIEEQFVKEAQGRYPLLMMTTDFSLFWLLVLMLACVAYIVTMLRRKRRSDQMTAEELKENGTDQNDRSLSGFDDPA